MSIRAEDRRRWRWPRFRLPQVMRPRLRWNTSAREGAMEETLSSLALTAECGGDPQTCLTLLGQSDVEPIGAQPGIYTVEIVIFFLLAVLFALPPAPYCALGAIFLLPILFTLRGASAGAHRIERTRLVTVELAQMLAEDMGRGRTMSQAMAEHPNVFSPAQVSLVRSGEHAGDLGGALRGLAREMDVRQRGKIIDALRIYFVAMLFAIVLIAAFLVGMVLPRFQDIYQSFGLEMPTLVEWVSKATSETVLAGSLSLTLFAFALLLCFFADLFTRQHFGRFASGLVCFAVFFILVPVLTFSWSQLAGTLFVFGPGPALVRAGMAPSEMLITKPIQSLALLLICMGLPFLFDLIRGGAAALGSAVALTVPALRHRRASLERANFFTALGLLLERRTPAPEALRLAAPALAPAGLQRRAEHSAALVERGTSLFDALRELRLIRRREEVLLRVAAKGNALPRRCHAIGGELADEAHERVAMMERLLRPLVVLLVGLVALTLMLSIYIPIFEIAFAGIVP